MGNCLDCVAKQGPRNRQELSVLPPVHTEVVNTGNNNQAGNLDNLPPSYEEAIGSPGVQIGNVAQPGNGQARVLVAAIDFGTTFSGYAFSFRHDYNIDPLKISLNYWQHNNGLSNKAPTAVLIGPDRKVRSFGYDAEKEYADKLDTKDLNNWYYFHRFKMRLYQDQQLTVNTMLADINGKELPAIDVFSGVIEYIRNHLLSRLRGIDTQGHIAPSSIHWVLTVPAIWNDKAKQFMRKAAQKAGIESSNLTLSLEPEAASLFCKRFQTFSIEGGDSQQYQPFASGTKYMILDLGGGTVDVTVHGIQSDGTLEEMHQATGGFWGGTTVDERFYSMLNDIFGRDFMEGISRRHPHEMLELQSEFEIKKRRFHLDQTASVIIRIPVVFVEGVEEVYGKKLSEIIQQSSYQEQIEFKKDKMFIKATLFSEFFSNSVSLIVGHIKELLQKSALIGISTILLVGGYSECPVVKETIVKTFPQLRVVRPDDPGLAVLKGAILFGHEPKAISSRVCKYTYGIAMTFPFKEGLHPENKRRHTRDGDVCDDIFDIHLRTGEKVTLDQNQPEKEYRFSPGHTTGVLELYASTRPNLKYVTEEGCTSLGSVVIENSEGFESGKIFAKLSYGGTELGIEARDVVTGKQIKASFDFLG